MNESELIARTVHERLEAGLPLVLVSMTGFQGSTPRHAGAKMVVGADGKSYGTIGGSLIEATAIAGSRRVFAAAQSRIIEFELDGKGAGSPGMICGGKAELLLDFLPATAANRELAGAWYDAVLHGREFFLLTTFAGTAGAPVVTGHALLFSDGRIIGSCGLASTEIERIKPELNTVSSSIVFTLKDVRLLADRIRRLKTLYCFGAGHVAVPTAHLAAMVGFRVVVIDDRPEYADAGRFPEAKEIRVIADFKRATEGLEIDADSFIIIVTRGHQYDREVLEQALKTSAGYIGMISSRRKKQVIYEALAATGVRKEELERVHSPIGLNIGGETPEEIAVSIIAELISERSKQKP